MRGLLFGKKRGSRRTGSNLVGGRWELLFFAGVFVLGLGGLVVVIGSLSARSWPATSYFEGVYYTSVQGRVGQSIHDGSISIAYLPRGSSDDDVRIPVDAPVPAGLQPGDEVTVWYDPNFAQSVGPERLQRPQTWGLWLTLAVLAALTIVGASGVVRLLLLLGVSQERRTALAQRAADTTNAIEESTLPKLPTIPIDENLTNSPGVKLAYRLPVEQPPTWKLTIAAFTALACVALATGFFVVVVAKSWAAGGSAWLMLLLGLPLLLLAVWAAQNFLRELLDATAVGATQIEISTLPLLPGERSQIYLIQSAGHAVDAVSLLAACEERTTFLQGTDIRHDCQRVFEEQIADSRIETPSDGIQLVCDFTPPAGAMHSFQTPHNAVQWRLIAVLSANGVEVARRSFPLVVRPTQ